MADSYLPREGIRRTVLLCEDHAALLKLVRQILEDADFNVIAAKNAREALRLEADYDGPIDVLLSDVRMRGKSGLELARKVVERRPGIRVVLMSGYPVGTSQLHRDGWQYLQKPFRPAALVDKIKGALHGDGRAIPPMAAGSFVA